MLSRILLFLVSLCSFFLFPTASFASQSVNVYLFWGEGCPHCAKEKLFLEKLHKKYQINLYDYEIWYNPSHADLLEKVGSELNTDIAGVPFTVVGENYFSGYSEDTTSGMLIQQAVEYCVANTCNDPVGRILGVSDTRFNTKPNKQAIEESSQVPQSIPIPFLGDLEIKDMSLPVLTLVIAALDGFNPCAMWTLLFLLSLLIGMHDRKKMWILGGAFIFASAFVYFLFMVAWLKLILFIGFIFWVRFLIGIIGFGGGIYNIRKYFTDTANACPVTKGNERQKVFHAVKHFVREKHFWLAIVGIVVLAFAVNLIELVCSAGLPVLYTQVLSLSPLSMPQYYLYILLYVFIFMLDDLFVFIVTIKTLELTGLTTKYTRLSHMVGGVIMAVLGVLLIVKPELLMFG